MERERDGQRLRRGRKEGEIDRGERGGREGEDERERGGV